ncbi:SDR family NAD(P)-dependent oxidoreductase [Variovorax sp. LjRoot178]|uniref:SDR family NAD(P)-dependent oxidoreductase n=1 Tax=Variovorax sp. LjRoot178 TaxID=3342277 RepID=UPI003ED01157
MTSERNSRVALVTGGGSGIGRRVAEKLALEHSARVYVLDRDADASAAVVDGIVAAGGRATACLVDLADSVRLRERVDFVTAEFGPPDILVNNAGISAMIRAEECLLEQWQAMVNVNVTAPMLLMQHALPHMKQQRWGRIVNVASISGIRAGTGRMPYGTSKAALIAMSRQFAVEVAPWGVTVNSIAPGPVDTPLARANHSAETRDTYGEMVPMRRYGTPDEIADAILFLASEQASYITGQTLAVDGGFVAAGILVNDLHDDSSALKRFAPAQSGHSAGKLG